MNIYSLKDFLVGCWDRNALRMAFEVAIPMPSRGYYHRYSGKSKTFKKNRRRGL